jgi:hypothetical protein
VRRIWPGHRECTLSETDIINLYKSTLSITVLLASTATIARMMRRSSDRRDSTAPSQEANYVGGYNGVIERLRGVTMHPLGMLVTKFLNRAQAGTRAVLQLPAGLHQHRLEVPEDTLEPLRLEFQEIITTWLTAENNDEVNLTKALVVGMNTNLQGCDMRAIHQEEFTTRGKVRGRADITVRRNVASTGPGPSTDPYVLLLEAGLFGSDWWLKAHLVFLYAALLAETALLAEPTLMAVFTLDSTKPKGSNDRVLASADAGCFLLIPKETRDFCLALLWRGEAMNTDHQGVGAKVVLTFMANFLADVLEATKFVARWNQNPPIVNYEYLGPHCCRLDGEVRGSSLCWCCSENHTHDLLVIVVSCR